MSVKTQLEPVRARLRDRRVKRVLIGVGAALIALALLGGCATSCTSTAQPVTCATYLDANGQWREEDNEVVDDDPCDTDDLFEDASVKTSTKPQPKPRTTRKKL